MMPPLSTTYLAASRANSVLPVPYYPDIVVIFPTGYPPPYALLLRMMSSFLRPVEMYY